jgi:hypothetical protein
MRCITRRSQFCSEQISWFATRVFFGLPQKNTSLSPPAAERQLRTSSRELPKALPVGAPGIAVEILFYRAAVKKIGTESPVFLPACGQKKAPKFRAENYKSSRVFRVPETCTART